MAVQSSNVVILVPTKYVAQIIKSQSHVVNIAVYVGPCKLMKLN